MNIHLTSVQKKALQVRAKTRNTRMSEEIRSAVDFYLSGVMPDELAMLYAATRAAKTILVDMADTLDETNRKAMVTFAELSALRAGRLRDLSQTR